MARRTVALFMSILLLATGILVATQTQTQAAGTQFNVVALGDSYTSGNGALNYFHQECYRSGNAYVYQYARLVQQSGVDIHPDNYACHGATTQNIAGQISEAGAALKEAELVFVTIGGNDGNFKDIVVDCLAPSRHFQLCHDDINAGRERLDDMMRSVRDSLLKIRNAAPRANVVLIGYPYLIGKGCFADADIVRSFQAAGDTHMFLMVDQLRKDTGPWVQFKSLLVPFTGGEVCGDSSQLIRGTFDTANFNEWWHPNVEGHAVTAHQLFDLGLHVQLNEPAPNSPAPVYQEPAPTNGQPVYANLPFECGEEAPFASTYDVLGYGGSTYVHGHALDFPMPRGAAVVAPESGVAKVYLTNHGYGKYVDVHGDSGTLHRFAHLEHPSISDGQRVGRGQKVGIVGSTGASTGPHLHYEQRRLGVQQPIELGGPTLQWGPALDASGYRKTAHALVSGNCAHHSMSRGNDDIMTLSYNHFAWGRSDGRVRDEWGTAKQNVFVPESTDSCDFDRDGFDEYIVLDVDTARIMMADPKGTPNGHFYWRQIGTSHTARKIVCGDWNNDGFDDVMFHNTKNVIYFGRSNGTAIAEWKVARLQAGSRPTYWDMCDINGDGRDDVVTYHAGTRRFLVGYRASGVTMHRKEIKGNVGNVGGFTCGQFYAGKNDSVILWNAGYNGRFILARWNGSYTITSWYMFDKTNIRKPYQGEMAAADIDGDGLDEIFVNIHRPDLGYHRINVMNITGTKSFEWYTFQDRMQASFLAGGEFVR